MKKRINNCKLLMLFLCLIFVYTGNNVAGELMRNKIEIDKVDVDSGVLEEWKNPGRYSPLNAFDNNRKTSFSEGAEYMSSFILYLTLKEKVKFDEIRIAAGLFYNEKLYRKNNRVKKLSLYLYKLIKGNSPFVHENIIYKRSFELEDVMEYQRLILDRPYSVKYISFVSSEEVYKGAKYNDTCISDIQFYYRGKRIPIVNLKESKKRYIERIEKRLQNIFSDKRYKIDNSQLFAECRSDGTLSINTSIPEERKYLSQITIWKITHWKVKNKRLYLKLNNKWGLVKYKTGGKSIYIESIGNEDFNSFFYPIEH